MKRLLLALTFFVPAFGIAQTDECIGATTDILARRYVNRTTINDVQSQAGTWVVGSYAGNWDTSVQQRAYYEGSQSHYGAQTIQNGPSTITFNDTPSSKGTGSYANFNSHQASCDKWPYTTSAGTSSDTQQVDAPEIESLPYSNALWYFGSGTPSAVPAHVGFDGGYAYQYANLTYDKNCLDDDACDGSVTWGEIDTPGAISVTSVGVLTSTKGHSTCSWDSAVTATLDGWTISESILVAKPTGVTRAYGQSVTTSQLSNGYGTDHPWEVNDTCGYKLPSMAVNETFGAFSEHASVTAGWGDPTASHPSGWADEYFFTDRIGADDELGPPTWDPAPEYTGPGPKLQLHHQAEMGHPEMVHRHDNLWQRHQDT